MTRIHMLKLSMQYLSSSFSNNGCSGLSANYFGNRECKCHAQSGQDVEKAIHNKGARW